MNSKLTIGAELGLDSFDPMNIDISEFDSLISSIPKDGNVDLSIAPKLAAQFLRAADKCSTILSSLTWHEQQIKDERKRAYARAVINAKAEGPKKTDAIAKYEAELDTSYIEACEKAIRAEASRAYFKNKHESFLRAHHLMKDMLRGEQSGFRAAGMPETVGAEEESRTGEVSWDE